MPLSPRLSFVLVSVVEERYYIKRNLYCRLDLSITVQIVHDFIQYSGSQTRVIYRTLFLGARNGCVKNCFVGNTTRAEDSRKLILFPTIATETL